MTNHSLFDHFFFFKTLGEKIYQHITKAILPFIIGLLFLCTNTIYAQNKTISGIITDGDLGGPLPGATVLVKGTTNGASTDFDGKFTLNSVNPNATLVVSFIGYISQEINLAGRTNVNIQLKPDMQALDEVVVIGYGTARKSDLTGSVVAIGGDDLKKQSISSVAEALTGRLAGVQVTSTEGSPDAEINIRIRGGGSLTQDSSPLIIVDGFPVNSMGDVTPSDIENITVLKDASSTAIYGSRGANGVVIITTKSGKDGKIQVNYNYVLWGEKTS